MDELSVGLKESILIELITDFFYGFMMAFGQSVYSLVFGTFYAQIQLFVLSILELTLWWGLIVVLNVLHFIFMASADDCVIFMVLCDDALVAKVIISLESLI